ncbi:MAG: PHP domain-containing protein [Clostridia bacterium]|nr:PHP domain-containing protein [Clostridia bacterium]
MKYFTDLHIHTALSPCADDDMTPNNIVNMACLKELSFIAITDHNSMLNVESCMKCASEKDIIVVPGMEVSTSEDIHVLCLFSDLDTLKKFDQLINESLPDIKNRSDLFGNQLILDENDELVGQHDQFLLTGCGYSIDEINRIVIDMGGVFIPSHIYREATGILSILGTVPEDLMINFVEVEASQQYEGYQCLRTSDAHHLESILEKEQPFDLEEKSIESLFSKLKYIKNVKF